MAARPSPALCMVALWLNFGDALHVISPAQFAGHYQSPPMRNSVGLQPPTNFSAVAPFKLTDVDGCKPIPASAGVRGYVVTNKRSWNCPERIVAQNAKDAGIVALIQVWEFVSEPGQATYFDSNTDATDIQIPLLIVGQSFWPVYQAVSESGANVTLHITIDSNTWIPFFRSPAYVLILHVLMSVIAFGNVILASYRWLLFFQALSKKQSRRWPVWNLAMWALALEVYCNLQRGVFTAVDGIFATSTFSGAVKHAMLTAAFPFSSATTLMISVVWKEAAAGMKEARAKRRRRRTVAAAVAFLLFALEASSAAMRAQDMSSVTLLIVMGATQVLFTLIIGISFLVNGCKLLAVFKQGNSYASSSSGDGGNSRSQRFQRTMTRWVMASGGSMLLWLVAMSIGATPIASSHYGYLCGYTILWGSYVVTSFTQIMAFKPPPPVLPACLDKVSPAQGPGASAASAAVARASSTKLTGICAVCH